MAAILYLTLSVIVIGSVSSKGARNSLQCRDENNQPVDWYVMYKIPKLSQTSNPLIRQGIAYQYITSSTVGQGWKLSEKSINSSSSLPGNTLAPLYEDDDSSLWTLYNDQAPDKSTGAKYGHTKGVVMANEKQGFWLIHSVPNYPPIPKGGVDPPARARSERSMDSMTTGGYDYPTTGKTYGQSFLCISVDDEQFEKIGEQLMYNQIISYRNNLPDILARQYPTLTRAANKIRIKDAPYNRRALIKSLDGVEFNSFAKSDKWGKDLYDDFVAPQLGTDLYAETWPNGPGRLPSDCGGSKVMNIKSILLEKANVDFTTTHDHSKWAISVSGKKKHNWVCIGDINRAKSQLERGGGTVCLNLSELWGNYRGIVNDVEPCPKKGFVFKSWIKSIFG